MLFTKDGQLAATDRETGKAIVEFLRTTRGYHFGEGECGTGLYSRNWDRQWAEFQGPIFFINPSQLYDLPNELKNKTPNFDAGFIRRNGLVTKEQLNELVGKRP